MAVFSTSATAGSSGVSFLSKLRWLLLWAFIPAALGTLLLSVARADFALEDWRYFKAIQAPAALDGEELAELALDREVFQQSASGQRDLRVVAGDETGEVAYQLVTATGRRERTMVGGRVRDLSHAPNRHSSFVVDLAQAGILHNQVEVLTSSQNFQRNVAVEASPDGQSWSLVQESSQIFDFTVEERGFTAKDTRISYPESSHRYLRVSVINNDEAPLAITGAAVSSVRESPASETRYPGPIIGRSEDREALTSIMEMDLGGEGLPINRLILHTSAVNFHRDVSVMGSNDLETWSTLASGVAIYSFRTAKFVGDSLEVAFPESTHRYFRLVIQNRDDPPLTVDEIAFSGIDRKVLFLAQPGTSYALYYGNEAARAPSYDLARLLPYLDTESPAAATFGPQQANPEYAGPQPPASEQYPWLITVAVAAAAVVVAAILFGVFRQVRKALPPPDSAER